jgi:hypothetical protein
MHISISSFFKLFFGILTDVRLVMILMINFSLLFYLL